VCVIRLDLKRLDARVVLGCGPLRYGVLLYYIRLCSDTFIGCEHVCAGISFVSWLFSVQCMIVNSEYIYCIVVLHLLCDTVAPVFISTHESPVFGIQLPKRLVAMICAGLRFDTKRENPLPVRDPLGSLSQPTITQ